MTRAPSRSPQDVTPGNQTELAKTMTPSKKLLMRSVDVKSVAVIPHPLRIGSLNNPSMFSLLKTILVVTLTCLSTILESGTGGCLRYLKKAALLLDPLNHHNKLFRCGYIVI